VLKAYLPFVCTYDDRRHSATWRTNSMMVKNNQLVCNIIQSCFLRICKLNSYTLLNLNGLVLFPLLFDKPNARQCQSDMILICTLFDTSVLNTHIHKHTYIYTYKHTQYTGCHRRKGPNFGRVFLMLNYTDITQNTYIQS